jgi:S1-C subfamily serine protease
LNNYAIHKKTENSVQGLKTSPLAVVIILLVFICACVPFSSILKTTEDLPVVPATESVLPLPTQDRAEIQESLTILYERVNPGVVAIRVQTTGQDGFQGSGFVYDQKGNIVTNYHVVENAQTIDVNFADGYRAEGQIVGKDLDSDIAVIRIDVPPAGLKPLLLGNSAELKVGQTVIAIGNPFGLSGTMTTGIISALGRTLESMHQTPDGGYYSSADLVQTDAAINPGNSGGPLLNLKGEVIGINRAIQTTGSSQLDTPLNNGIGFAVPVDIVKKVVPVLISRGTFDYPYLGIITREQLSIQNLLALEVPTNTVGIYIMEVTADGPAERAGLKGASLRTATQGLMAGGDWIIAINGKKLTSYSSLLTTLVVQYNVGDTITLTILRDGQEMQLPLTLGKRPD